ncbi:hypothetical protein SAMN05216327_115128 [Dyadobacter sp. SG02]|uniref:hypothetical protein n=1 Tax=Dyadobacter sp. SG02 TaxID=1855291 RepID=UPI0008C01EED|nr:hypothetical protein [Dyadobacter sp. SG02]SEJ66253.1 hypothetical protein SAMN05216327_115128 [Dyadobacter sp. SG02]
MKTRFIFALLLVSLTSLAQRSEFKLSENGLIYSNATVGKLKHIVDSLNLKFKVCDLSKVFVSQPQAKAHYVLIEGRQAKVALADMHAGLSFDTFLARYPTAVVDNEMLIIKYGAVDYKDRSPVTAFSNVNGKGYYAITLPRDSAAAIGSVRGKWVAQYNKYGEGMVEAFYFIDDFAQKPIPEKYARWIQYVDCLVDTTGQIFTKHAVQTGNTFKYKVHPKDNALQKYISNVTKRPRWKQDMTDKEIEVFTKAADAWESLRIARVDSLRKTSAQFNQLLAEAIEEAKQMGNDNDVLEEYIERYYSPELALQLKRDRIVIGGCSMDESPRYHALNIARLSAHTVKWEVFLRAHLDIMNDNFQRVSDGSWAWAGRKTYIKELEVLDINVPDLMMGTLFRLGNANENHYLGSVGRMGRSLSESANRVEMEVRMLEMISDISLDDYNRALAYYLFKSYNYHLSDKSAQARNSVALGAAVKNWPHYLTVNIDRE